MKGRPRKPKALRRVSTHFRLPREVAARIAREAKGLQMSQADYVSAKVMGRL